MIIALAGARGCGKNYVADMMAELVDVPVHFYAFADLGKESLASFFGVSREQLEILKSNPEAKVFLTSGYEAVEDELEAPVVVTEMTVRRAHERYMTEAHREIEEFGEDFWLEHAKLPFSASDDNSELILITDLRFESEAIALRMRDAWLWEVVRDGYEYPKDHAAEMGLPQKFFDFHVYNRDSQQQLREELSLALRRLGFTVLI